MGPNMLSGAVRQNRSSAGLRANSRGFLLCHRVRRQCRGRTGPTHRLVRLRQASRRLGRRVPGPRTPEFRSRRSGQDLRYSVLHASSMFPTPPPVPPPFRPWHPCSAVTPPGGGAEPGRGQARIGRRGPVPPHPFHPFPAHIEGDSHASHRPPPPARTAHPGDPALPDGACARERAQDPGRSGRRG